MLQNEASLHGFVLNSSGTLHVSKESLESKQTQTEGEQVPPPADRPDTCSSSWNYRILIWTEGQVWCCLDILQRWCRGVCRVSVMSWYLIFEQKSSGGSAEYPIKPFKAPPSHWTHTKIVLIKARNDNEGMRKGEGEGRTVLTWSVFRPGDLGWHQPRLCWREKRS